jgi:hypothetical protein
MCRWLAYPRNSILLEAFWFEVKLKGRKIVGSGDDGATRLRRGPCYE